MSLEGKEIGYNIVLCGFMGCGKSTVGKELAKFIKMDFIDIDTYIESKENMTVSKIFKLKGEKYFRKLETKAILNVTLKPYKIIALGGGSLLNKKNVEVLKRTSKIFFLNASKKVIMDRLKYDNSRPLLNVDENGKVLSKLYDERFCIYRENADITIDANGNISKIISDILAFI